MTKPCYIPKRAVFEATLACNLRCRHCGSIAGKARPDELDTDEVRDLFRQLAELGCEKLTISGGEPTCRKDWPDLIGAAAGMGIAVGMFTNGVSFDEDAARRAKDRGLQAVGFSVDGPREVHDYIRGRVGHFERLSRAMDACATAGLRFAVVSFVNPRNLNRLDEMHRYIRDKGAFAWQIQLGTDMGNLSDNRDLILDRRQLPRLEALLADLVRRDGPRIDVADSIGYFGPHERILRKNQHKRCFGGCSAGTRNIGIESNGNIKGCLSIMAGYNPQGADFVEGNIREASLAEIWHRPGAFAYNREWSIEQLSGFCRACRHAPQCRGGCRAKVTAFGDGVENPMCVYRVAVEEGLRHRRAPAAAALLASSLLGVTGCYESSDKEDAFIPPYGGPFADAGTDDSDSVGDTATTGREPLDTHDVEEYGIVLDTGTGGEVDEYGIVFDTETQGGVDEYGVVLDTDPGVDDYAIPVPTDTDTEVTTDDEPVLIYGILLEMEPDDQ